VRIYFSKASDADIDFFGDEGTFKLQYDDNTTSYYYQMVEFGVGGGGLEEVTLNDTCNRSIPIAVETIPQLVEALNHCYNLHIRYTNIMQEVSRAEEVDCEAVVTTGWDDQHEVEFINQGV